MAQHIKDLALSLQWCGFDPWPGTSACHGYEKNKIKQKGDSSPKCYNIHIKKGKSFPFIPIECFTPRCLVITVYLVQFQY